MENKSKAGKMTVTFPDGSRLTAMAPMGLPGTLATVGWEAHRARAAIADMDMTSIQRLLRHSDALRALRQAGY